MLTRRHTGPGCEVKPDSATSGPPSTRVDDAIPAVQRTALTWIDARSLARARWTAAGRTQCRFTAAVSSAEPRPGRGPFSRHCRSQPVLGSDGLRSVASQAEHRGGDLTEAPSMNAIEPGQPSLRRPGGGAGGGACSRRCSHCSPVRVRHRPYTARVQRIPESSGRFVHPITPRLSAAGNKTKAERENVFGTAVLSRTWSPGRAAAARVS